MNIKTILMTMVLSTATIVSSNAQTKEKSAEIKRVFKVSQRLIKQGDHIQITYNPAVNGISGDTPVSGSVYVYRNFKWQGFDLPLIKTDSGYTNTYLVPEGTAMLAWRFSIGDSTDRGGKFPFANVVYAKDQKPVPGSLIEWGLLRSNNPEGEISPLVAKEALIRPEVLVKLWISKEFNDPLVKRNLFFDIANGLKSYMPKEKFAPVLLKAGNEITTLPDVTEKELISVEKVYRSVLQNPTLADSLKTTILAKYPDGLMNRLQLIKADYLEPDKDKKLQLWNDFIKAYPFAQFSYEDYLNPALSEPIFFINSYVSACNITFQKHQLDQLAGMVGGAPISLVDYFYQHYVDYPFRQQVSPITDKEALTLSVAIADMLMKRIETGSLIDRGIYAPAEWTKQEILSSTPVWVYHLGLLYKNGQYEAALKIAEKVKPYLGYKIISFNTFYVRLLNHVQKTAQVVAYTIAAIKADTASPEMLELFKANWVKSHGGKADGFDVFYETLRPADKKNDMHASLKAAMMRIPAINFNLQNLQGKQIDLGQQKGKIVVLDFWASWCFPCKAAMPGMQTLVNKYEPGGDVAFFFIATMEVSPDYKKLINDFLAAKKYNFNVLYDAEDPETKKMGVTFNDYAGLLKLSGIPQKIIIDQHGFVRWVAGGFNGDLVQLEDEVSYVIELLKKEK